MKSLGNAIPLVKLLVPFILGLLWGFNWTVPLGAVLLGCFMPALLFVLLKGRFFSYQNRYMKGVLLLITAFFLGIFLVSQHQSPDSNIHFSKQNNVSSFYIIRLNSPPKETRKSFKYVGDVRFYGDLQNINSATGRVLIYLSKEAKDLMPALGDQVIIFDSPKAIEGPRNPFEFDYKSHLQSKRISHQFYLKESNFKILSTSEVEINTDIFFLNLRKKLLDRFETTAMGQEEFAVVSALAFGSKDELDEEQYKSFSHSGVIHVLAVSGLHVGLIYMVLNWLLRFLNRSTITLVFKTVLLLAILWFYAFLTGMSPSVSRATTMFSFIILAKILFKNSSTYNTLAASAFVLLLIDPFQIYDLGFQLSYSAVFGIVYAQPKIYGLLRFKTILLNKIWELTSVSVAAQLFTLPLTLYYFHQFPTYFLLSNILVIPLATLILYLSFLYLLVQPVNGINTIVFQLLDWSTAFLNAFVQFISKLPGNLIDGIYLWKGNVAIAYLILFFFLVFFSLKWKKMLLLGMLLVFVFQCGQFLYRAPERFVTMYSIPRKSCLSYFNKHSITTLSNLEYSKENWDFKIRSHHEFADRKESLFEDFNGKLDGLVFKRAGFMQIENLRFFIPDEIDSFNSNGNTPEVDIIFIKNNIDNWTHWKDAVEFDKILIDSSVNLQVYEKVISWACQEKIELIDVYYKAVTISI